MNFVYVTKRGEVRELLDDEVREYLSEAQIAEAIEAKQADPNEEVSYMAPNGFIICEF